MRILVVEDERLLCDGIAEDLRLEKYTVDCCYDGPAACERLFVEPYDLVVLDLNLSLIHISPAAHGCEYPPARRPVSPPVAAAAYSPPSPLR